MVADSAMDAGEQGFLSSLPIVLTPSRLPQPQNEAPAATTVIDRTLIKATGYRDLPRLLRLVPGMQVGQERGNSHWVTYHGMGNDYPSWMQILVDGRSVYSPGNFDGVDWSFLPVTIDEVERIEVVRGTDSVAFGSNAVLGVVNIITRHSRDDPVSSVAASLGNQGVRDLDAQYSKVSERGGLRVSAALKQDKGFDSLHDGRRVAMVSLRGDYRLDHHNELMVRVGGSDGWRELGYPDSTYDNNAERTAEAASANLHLQWRHVPRSEEEWSVHYYRNQDVVDEAWNATAPLASPFPGAKVPLDRNRESSRDSIELQHRLAWTPSFRTVWGLEYRQDQIEAPFLYYGAPEQTDRLGRVFGQADWWLMPTLGLNVSGLLESFEDQPTRFSPRAFVNWKATPSGTFRAGYARAWREPFVFERYGDVQVWYSGVLLAQPYAPNPDLDPSRMDSVELGYLGQFAPWETRLDVRVFQERITDFITRVSIPSVGALGLPTARYDNLSAPVTLRGIEYQVDTHPWAGGRVLFSHALIKLDSAGQLPRLVAPYSASLSWFQSYSARWSSSLTVLRMGPLAGGTGFVPTTSYESPAYTALDFKLSHTPLMGFEVALVGTNLGGHHQEIADRSEQALHPGTPVNQTSPMLWLTLSYRLP